MSIDFWEGIPVSRFNLEGYRKIFCLEQWLRRVARVALMATVGEHILSALDSDLLLSLKQRAAALRSSSYLGVAPVPDLLSLTTLEELRNIVTLESVFPAVRRLSGLERNLLLTKLDEIREIRNAVGHHRQLSEKTYRILDADILSLESGISQFRSLMCGIARTRWLDGISERSVADRFDDAVRNRRDPIVPSRRLYVSEDREFIFCGVIPRHLDEGPAAEDQDSQHDYDESTGEVDELGSWIDIAQLTAALSPVEAKIAAIVIPVRCTSFELVWSKKVSPVEQVRLFESFAEAVDKAWGDADVSEQDSWSFTNERVWLGEELGGTWSAVVAATV